MLRKLIWLLFIVAIGLYGAVQFSEAQDPPRAEFQTADGSLAFTYPEEWHAENQGISVVVVNRESLLEVNSPDVEAGDFMLYLYGYSSISEIGVETSADAAEALDLIISNFSGRLTFSPVETFTAGEYSGYQATFTFEEMSGLYLTVEIDEQIFTVTGLTAETPIEDYIPEIHAMIASLEFEADQVDLDTDRLYLDATVGPEDAPYVFYEYGAYGCHACRSVHQQGVIDPILEFIEENPDGSVRFVFVNFPVIVPRLDPIAAEVGQCVLDQGQDVFWSYHDAIYDMSDAGYGAMNGEADFIALALQYGAEQAELETCMEERLHRGTVQYHLNRSSWQGVLGTPTFYLNDEEISPSQIPSLLADITSN